jgi:hypothetical protein
MQFTEDMKRIMYNCENSVHYFYFLLRSLEETSMTRFEWQHIWLQLVEHSLGTPLPKDQKRGKQKVTIQSSILLQKI